jgi:hypothetical protein
MCIIEANSTALAEAVQPAENGNARFFEQNYASLFPADDWLFMQTKYANWKKGKIPQL